MTPIDLRPKVSGRYTFRKVNCVTGQVTELKESATNLLLEPFFRESLSNIAANQGFMSAIVVGSGNTPPMVTNTTLESFVAASVLQQGAAIPNVVNSTVFPRYVTRSFTKRFSGTAIAGIPLSEMGVAITTAVNTPADASTPLASRALIVDASGSPTSLTVLADEFLDVTYSMTTYALDGVTGSFDINVLGTVETFDYEIRPVCMNHASEWCTAALDSGVATLGAKSFPGVGGVTSLFSGASASAIHEDPSLSTQVILNSGDMFTSYAAVPVWDPSEMTATGALNLPLNNGNFVGGIRSFVLRFGSSNSPSPNYILGTHRMVLDRPLMKTANHVFEFPITLGLSNASPPVA